MSPRLQGIVKSELKIWEGSLDRAFNRQVDETITRLLASDVSVHLWSKEELKRARNIAMQVWHEYAAKSELAARVISELVNWLKEEGNI